VKGMRTVIAPVLQPSLHYLRSICMQSESMYGVEVPMASFAEDGEGGRDLCRWFCVVGWVM
jgi:hypothetical protein